MVFRKKGWILHIIVVILGMILFYFIGREIGKKKKMYDPQDMAKIFMCLFILFYIIIIKLL